MSWQAYVDTNLLGTGNVSQAAIYGLNGGEWAKSAGFQVMYCVCYEGLPETYTVSLGTVATCWSPRNHCCFLQRRSSSCSRSSRRWYQVPSFESWWAFSLWQEGKMIQILAFGQRYLFFCCCRTLMVFVSSRPTKLSWLVLTRRAFNLVTVLRLSKVWLIIWFPSVM